MIINLKEALDVIQSLTAEQDRMAVQLDRLNKTQQAVLEVLSARKVLTLSEYSAIGVRISQECAAMQKNRPA